MTDRIKKGKSKIKLSQSRHNVGSDQEREEKSTSDLPPLLCTEKVVKIFTIYDSFFNLVEIRFGKNNYLPRLIFKIIGLIIQFQPNIAKIEINGGMDGYTVYEINKFLNMSNITELCFDGCFLKEANYDILLDTNNSLRHLSLSRCKIDDNVVRNIANKLAYPLPASKSLYILNLSSNGITDLGTQYLVQALRSNRNLSYLNLADNRITDDGAGYLLHVFAEFPLTDTELLEARFRHMVFLKNKNIMIDRTIKELRSGELDRKIAKRKSTRPVSAASGKKGKLEKELSEIRDTKSLVNMDFLYYEKAVNMVENTLGEFNDPFCANNTNVKGGMVYSKGNNTLCYLNLAYNNLSFLSLKKILAVLMFQKLLDRKPRGLINLLIEGNNLPVSCMEMSQIDDVLEMGLMVHNRRLSGGKKRPQSKTTSR